MGHPTTEPAAQEHRAGAGGRAPGAAVQQRFEALHGAPVTEKRLHALAEMVGFRVRDGWVEPATPARRSKPA